MHRYNLLRFSMHLALSMRHATADSRGLIAARFDGCANSVQVPLFFFPGIHNRRDLLEQRRARRIGTSANELEA